MKNKTEKELNKIALALFNGAIFTDRHVTDKSMLGSVFMPLAFMTEDQCAEFVADPPGMIFEYLNEAGPMSINGMPCFSSMRMLSIEDTDRAIAKVKKLEAATKAALGETEVFDDGA